VRPLRRRSTTNPIPIQSNPIPSLRKRSAEWNRRGLRWEIRPISARIAGEQRAVRETGGRGGWNRRGPAKGGEISERASTDPRSCRGDSKGKGKGGGRLGDDGGGGEGRGRGRRRRRTCGAVRFALWEIFGGTFCCCCNKIVASCVVWM